MRLASHGDVLRVLRIAARAQVIDIGTHKDYRREQRSERVMLQLTPDTVWIFSRPDQGVCRGPGRPHSKLYGSSPTA